MTLVDSGVWIAYFNGQATPQTDRLDELLGQQTIALGDLILTEVLQGFRHDKDYDIAKGLLTSFDIFPLLGKDIAKKSAENFRKLRKRGITIRKTIDVIIATFCIENDLALLHCDKDFEPFRHHMNLMTAL